MCALWGGVRWGSGGGTDQQQLAGGKEDKAHERRQTQT